MPSSIASSLRQVPLRLTISASHPRSRLPSSRCCAVLPQSLHRLSSFISLRLAPNKAHDKLPQADEGLRRALQEEIEVTERKVGQEVELPAGFSFDIIDFRDVETVSLKREYAGETIRARVSMNENNEEPLSLVVVIDKRENPALEFECSLSTDKLLIANISIKSDDSDDQEAYKGQGFCFNEMNSELQKAFYDYLAARGIEGSLYGFLHEYMIRKVDMEYLWWLDNIEKVVKKPTMI